MQGRTLARWRYRMSELALAAPTGGAVGDKVVDRSADRTEQKPCKAARWRVGVTG